MTWTLTKGISTNCHSHFFSRNNDQTITESQKSSSILKTVNGRKIQQASELEKPCQEISQSKTNGKKLS